MNERVFQKTFVFQEKSDNFKILARFIHKVCNAWIFLQENCHRTIICRQKFAADRKTRNQKRRFKKTISLLG